MILNEAMQRIPSEAEGISKSNVYCRLPREDQEAVTTLDLYHNNMSNGTLGS